MEDVIQQLRDAQGNGHVPPIVAEAVLALAERVSLLERAAAGIDETPEGGE